MLLLELFYALARSTQKTGKQNAIRFIPIMTTSSVLFSVVYTVLVALTQRSSVLSFSRLEGSPNGLDTLAIASGATAVIASILWFDRRREQIDAKFPWMQPSSSDIVRLGVGGFLLGGSALIMHAGDQHPTGTAVAIASVCAFGEIILRVKWARR